MGAFFLDTYFLLLVMSALIGILRLRHYLDNYFKVFPFYLLLIFILDKFSPKIFGLLNMVNVEYFCKIVIPIEFLFFYWFYYKLFDNKLYKNIAVGGAVLYGLSCVVEMYILGHNPEEFCTTSYLVGGVVLLTLIITYFYNLITSDRILTFTKERFFYISLGLFIFYILSMPYFGLFTSIQANTVFSTYYDVTVKFTMCVMALLFGISFIWGTRN